MRKEGPTGYLIVLGFLQMRDTMDFMSSTRVDVLLPLRKAMKLLSRKRATMNSHVTQTVCLACYHAAWRGEAPISCFSFLAC